METKAINDFTKFLESNGYRSSTIRIYISYAGPFLEALACQTQAELEKQINLIVDNNNRLSPPIRHSLKAALNQFFLMKTGIARAGSRILHIVHDTAEASISENG